MFGCPNSSGHRADEERSTIGDTDCLPPAGQFSIPSWIELPRCSRGRPVSAARNHAGCWELRWTAEKVEHRIFGYFGEGKEFNRMVGCIHKVKIYSPTELFERLDQRNRQENDVIGEMN